MAESLLQPPHISIYFESINIKIEFAMYSVLVIVGFYDGGIVRDVAFSFTILSLQPQIHLHAHTIHDG